MDLGATVNTPRRFTTSAVTFQVLERRKSGLFSSVSVCVLGWFKSLLPKSALTAEEEAWNAYPYTKTRYTCPFVEKFSIEIETYYFGDNGSKDNVFNLSGSEKRNVTTGKWKLLM